MLQVQLRQTIANLHGDSGQTLVEYGLLLAMISLVGLGGVMIMVGGVNQLYEIVAQAYQAMCTAVGEGCP